MLPERSDSMFQKALKSLCCDNGWSYAVFWRFDLRNSLLLTMEDAYYEEQMGGVIDNMLLQVHLLGNGVVGQAAFTKRHRWMFSDARCRAQNPVDCVKNQDIFQDDSEIHDQFSSGIKTIVLISVEPYGVVQFGSTQKIPERMEFVDQTKTLFREIENGDAFILPENMPSSSNSETSGFFASLISTGNSILGDLKPVHGDSSRNYMATTCSSKDLPQLSPFTSDSGWMNSSHLGNQLQSLKSSAWFPEPLVQCITYSDHSALPSPCISTWSSGHSTLTSIDRQLPAQTRLVGSQDVSPTNTNSLTSCRNEVHNFQDSTFTAVHSTRELADLETRSTRASTFQDLFDVNHPSNSVQSSITNTFGSDGDEMFLNDSSIGNDFFDSLGADFECVLAEDFLDDIRVPVVRGDQLDFSADTSECISGQHVSTMIAPHDTLFSKLGLEQFLGGIAGSSNSIASSSFEYELSSASKRKMGSCSVSLPCFDGNMNSLHNVHNLEPRKEGIPKSEAGSWIGDVYSIACGTYVASQPKRTEKSSKVGKKRARPGSRPKPKDRQQIQDRIAELRKLIPNGVKMSIDSLLAQTVKHMLFLQSVTNHAEKIKHAEERKEKETVVRDDSSSSGHNARRACEVGETMVDPVNVKDLSLPGQMLIQMLCEEKGFFLEIVDIIQGFGLTILKGVMEVRENKIWACFVVEAEGNRHVMKQEIYLSLHRLLYQKATSEINLTDHLANVLNGGTALLNNYHQPLVPLPISLAETLD
ncbi:transcription factor bHLH157-like [Actinidia eriantha]|uniref:transcription factor bHLH157-like n=1 Tax=Actinidia eriantha TaxID=165200 RepID=UPI00258F3AB7|nr:transcription factor bHLH157-like [Actinidia eriantha]